MASEFITYRNVPNCPVDFARLLTGGDAAPLRAPGLLYRDAAGLRSLHDDKELESKHRKCYSLYLKTIFRAFKHLFC